MISIRQIESEKSKDLLRGLLNKNLDGREARTTLSKLLESVSSSDLRHIDALIRDDILFQHVPVVSEFPADPPFEGFRGYSLVPHDELVIDFICQRIEASEDRICEALSLLREMNVAIIRGDDVEMDAMIDYIVGRVGHSLTLARKLAFIIGYVPRDKASYRKSVEYVTSYGVNNNNYGIMAAVDSIGFEFNYLDLKYRFREYIDLKPSASISQKISHLCFSPVALDHKQFLQILRHSYDVTLLDAAMALLAHRDLEIADVPTLPATVEQAWLELSDSPLHLLSYFGTNDRYDDIQAFRSAPAFLEHAGFRNLRATMQAIFDLPEFRDKSGIAASAVADRFFANVKSIADLVPPDETNFEILPAVFETEQAGVMARSCAMVWLSEKDQDFSDLTAPSMALLMGHTTEVDRLISTPILRKAAASATDPFVKLILHTLLRAHSTATRDSYAFKEQFQTYVRSFHGGNILEFMEAVRQLSDNIVEYFVQLLDETMLSQMAFLMETSNSIYETRACLLEWYADVRNDQDSRDKAKQLRLDRKIAAVRGAINETRLNIDGVRFRQWIEQNKLNDFSDFTRQSSIVLPTLDDLTDRSKASTLFLTAHRDSTMRALKAITDCYAQFCKNPDFGIASFLGRRIRHGTLRGTLLSDIINPSNLALPPSISGQYQSWYREFSESINELATALHFHDKAQYKNGIISSEINSSEKWQQCLICLNAIFEQSQKDHGVLIIPLLIEQTCWLIFELELAGVQSSIMEARSKWGTLKLRNPSKDTDVIEFEKNTDLTLSNHFNTVLSWFKKPPNISPVAELGHVLDVVLQEACSEYPDFSPNVTFVGDEGLELTGTLYYFVYDALTIAVRNAAKHGQCPSQLSINVDVLQSGSGKLLKICVTNDLRTNDCYTEVLNQMSAAELAGPELADVVEGLSGMRKLKKMEVARSILSFSRTGCDGPPGTISVEMLFPLSGIVE